MQKTRALTTCPIGPPSEKGVARFDVWHFGAANVPVHRAAFFAATAHIAARAFLAARCVLLKQQLETASPETACAPLRRSTSGTQHDRRLSADHRGLWPRRARPLWPTNAGTSVLRVQHLPRKRPGRKLPVS